MNFASSTAHAQDAQDVKDEQHMKFLPSCFDSRSRGPHPGAAAVPRGGVGGGKVGAGQRLTASNAIHLGGRRKSSENALGFN